ncbi:MAG TPA: lysophospholipid acyltransferase family protein [Kofleriaceae bacterium]|nr:lysophospholipid acyltransferase family protein [Kofleriaceae bacterium]
MAWKPLELLDRAIIDRETRERVDRLAVDWNPYGIDPFGASKDDVARMYTILGWFYRNYFRVTVSGIEHVPAAGRAMLVGNHSGGFAVDAMMVLTSVFLELEPPRLAQGMAEKFLARLPFSAALTARSGQLTGLPEHATRLLEADRLLMVFPEGARGTEKLYGDRNRLVRFGTGFVRLALQTGTPIIPFGFLGGGEAVPTVMNLYGLGRLLGVPYIPVTKYIVPVPRPVPLEIYYSEPMVFDGTGNEEDEVIVGYVDQIKQRISGLIDAGYRRRVGG